MDAADGELTPIHAELGRRLRRTRRERHKTEDGGDPDEHSAILVCSRPAGNRTPVPSRPG
jgi:hypothetical protein